MTAEKAVMNVIMLAQARAAAALPIVHGHLKPVDPSSAPARYSQDVVQGGIDTVTALLQVCFGAAKCLELAAPLHLECAFKCLRLQCFIRIVQANRGLWVRRTALKAALAKQFADKNLLDICLKLLADTTFDGVAIFRRGFTQSSVLRQIGMRFKEQMGDPLVQGNGQVQ